MDWNVSGDQRQSDFLESEHHDAAHYSGPDLVGGV